MGIVTLAIRKPVTITMVVLGVLIFGYVSFQRLAVNLLPDISYPTLTVRTEYEGAAPEEVENLVSRRMEEAVGVISGLVEISSISRAGVSDVILEFDWDTDMNLATMEVRERVDRVNLPEGAERPLLLRFNPQLDPILRLGLSGGDLVLLRELAEWEIKRQLETIPGVASVRVKGGLEEEIHVEINEAQLTRLGLTFAQINQRLARENINLAGGRLKEGQVELLVRAVNEFQTVAEIGGLVITRPNGAPIHLSDVAHVSRSHKERKTITRINREESVEIAIYKEADANTVTVARAVKQRLGPLETEAEETSSPQASGSGKAAVQLNRAMTIAATLPAGVALHIISDQSRFIEGAIEEVLSTALYGAILAIFILYLFLRSVKSTTIIGVAIPVSILTTFTLMFLSDTTLNIMSLGGLALGIGMLVDNAIVVLESIFRCREEGDSIREAAVRGASEVGTAVTASTLTTIAVFFPIVFVKGVAGQIFTDQALTVTFSLLASLVVALTLIPMLASREGEVARGDGGFWLQEALQIYRRQSGPPPGSWFARVWSLPVWFVRRALYDAGRWFWRTFPGLHWFVQSGRQFINRDGPRRWYHWAFWFPVYLLGQLLLEAGTWLKCCVFQGKKESRPSSTPNTTEEDASEASSQRRRRLLRGFGQGAGWLIGFLVCFTGPFYTLLRFVLQSLVKIVGALFVNGLVLVLLVILAPLMPLLRFSRYLLNPLFKGFNSLFEILRQSYPPVLAWALSHRGSVVTGISGLLILSLLLLPRLGTELIPELEQGEFNIDVKLPVGTPLATTDQTVAEVETMVRQDPLVDRVFAVVGETEASGTLVTEERENVGRIGVVLKSEAINRLSSTVLIERLRARLHNLPDVTIEFARPALFSFKTPLEVEVQGYNLNELRRVSRQVVTTLAGMGGLRDVHSSMEVGHPEVVVVFDRERMAALGLDIGAAARAIRNKVGGEVATRFSAGDRKIDILVRAREEDRNQVVQLQTLSINSGNPNGQTGPKRPIPLGAVARIKVGEGPSEIRRIDQQRVALVSANLSGVDLGTVARRIQERLSDLELPPEFTVAIGGQYREMNTASRSMLMAMGMAIFLVYLVMASQFESLLHPFIIMFSFLLALVGVLFTLYLLHIAISVVVLIGVIMLAGIVVNNAIVLVDYINQLRRRGRNKMEAVMLAGQVRLRPILMTTATTVLGLLPMALGIGEGAEIRTPLAITVIAGLVSSTLLTLIVIPVIYTLIDRRP